MREQTYLDMSVRRRDVLDSNAFVPEESEQLNQVCVI
jgi:hypothetical protein